MGSIIPLTKPARLLTKQSIKNEDVIILSGGSIRAKIMKKKQEIRLELMRILLRLVRHQGRSARSPTPTPPKIPANVLREPNVPAWVLSYPIDKRVEGRTPDHTPYIPICNPKLKTKRKTLDGSCVSVHPSLMIDAIDCGSERLFSESIRADLLGGRVGISGK